MRKPNTIILYHKSAYWLASGIWNDPTCGLEANRHNWECLGSPGWFGTNKIRGRYHQIVEIVGQENMPKYPGEYFEFFQN